MDRQALFELAVDIAAHLGNGFVAKQHDGYYGISLDSPPFELSVQDSNKNGVITISGVFGKLWQHVYHSEQHEGRLHINCSVSKGAERIAKDIANRLLPGYVKLYRAVQVRAAEYDAEGRRKFEVAKRLAAIIGTEPRDDTMDYSRSPTFHVYGSREHGLSATFCVTSADSVRFESGWMPVDVAEKVLVVFAEHLSKKEATCT